MLPRRASRAAAAAARGGGSAAPAARQQRRHKTYKIVMLPGDGVGPEVLGHTQRLLDAVGFLAEYQECDIGWDFWCKEGNAFPQRTIDVLAAGNTDAALFAAITSKPTWDADLELAPELQGKGLKYSSPIVGMRQLLNLHTNFRPCKAFAGNPRNLHDGKRFRDDIDMVIFRENTEGMYGGVEFHPLPEEVYNCLDKNHPKMKKFKCAGLDNIAMSTRIMTRQACERIIRGAFEFAKKNGRKSVTVVDKPNVLRETGGLMVKTARAIAQEYPDIPMYEANIDAMCMFMIKDPANYDVIVAENMFGDILSDLAAQMVGGLGFAPTGNLGDNYGVFEPSHGSAPKYTGQDRVNPIAMMLTAELMLRHLGEGSKADAMNAAIARVVKDGKVATKDYGGTASATQLTAAIIAAL